MCLTLVQRLEAVRPRPVAHQRAALTTCLLQRLERQQIWPPPRPVAVSSSSNGSTESDSAPSAPPSPRWTSTPCTEEAMTAKVPSKPPSPSLADSSLEVRQILRDETGHALTHSEYQKQMNAAKQRATVLK